MSRFKIITDTTADLPQSYLKEHGVEIMVLPYTIDGTTYASKEEPDYKMFYNKIREGHMATTSQANPAEAKEVFEQALTETSEILCISFSSGLSGTYNSVKIAAEDILEERTDCKIMVIDTKAASLGEGLLVYKAIQMRALGKSMEETAAWIETYKMNLQHVFTVEDLNHLYRGGRIGKVTALVGTMVNIKPILKFDEEGHLVVFSRTRGRKKSLHELVDYMEQKIGEYRAENDIICISHADALEDAELVKEEVKARFGIETFLLDYMGPTIGAHAGPGTIALFFIGEKR